MDKTIIGENTAQHKIIEKLTPYLRIKSPDNLIMRIRLSQNKITIGRGDNCNIILHDEMASREHCQVWLDEKNNIHILDLNSTNGSRIDGKHIHQAVLQPHNRLKIGHHVIKVEYKDADEIRQEELLQEAATCDPLTGISNRKWFEERVNLLFQSLANKKQHIAIIMLDIDHFKQVNDTYGHQTGDTVIKSIANMLSKCKRQQDFLARYGGEEFILCLSDSTSSNTTFFCERVRKKIADISFLFDQKELNVTVSLGACVDTIRQDSTLNDMTALADKALYQSKKAGRNQTTITNASSK